MLLASASLKYEKAGVIQKQIEGLKAFNRFLKKQPLAVPDMVILQSFDSDRFVASWIIDGRLNKSKIVPNCFPSSLKDSAPNSSFVKNPNKRHYFRYERTVISKWIGKNKESEQVQIVLL